MARVKRSVNARKKRKKVMDRASGYTGARSRRYRTAREQVMHAMQDSYDHRRARKGQFRRLWIQRINAAARINGTTYSRFMAGLKAADVEVDRKMLAEMAISDPDAFTALVKVAGKGDARVEALRLAEAFRAQVIDASTEHFVFEITGRLNKIEQFITLMQPLGLVEVARTGVAAIGRGKEAM